MTMETLMDVPMETEGVTTRKILVVDDEDPTRCLGGGPLEVVQELFSQLLKGAACHEFHPIWGGSGAAGGKMGGWMLAALLGVLNHLDHGVKAGGHLHHPVFQHRPGHHSLFLSSATHPQQRCRNSAGKSQCRTTLVSHSVQRIQYHRYAVMLPPSSVCTPR